MPEDASVVIVPTWFPDLPFNMKTLAIYKYGSGYTVVGMNDEYLVAVCQWDGTTKNFNDMKFYPGIKF